MTNIDMLDALPPGTVVSYSWDGDAYRWTKRPDGRWTGRYTLTETGGVCTNGIRSARVVARVVDACRPSSGEQ